MKAFLKGMLEGFLMAVGSLAILGLFFAFLGALYLMACELHLSYIFVYIFAMLLVYSLVWGFVEYFRGNK